jgi:DNA-binding transcriptional MerR regulator
VAGVASSTRASGGSSLLSIGQVLARLSPEFPDLSPSKLRFLEERNLVTPSRTESGYRKFSASDLERLRLVLSMQRDYYLPLKVIRSYLDDLDAGREPVLPGGATVQAPSMLSGDRRLSRVELIKESGANAMLLNDAISASLLVASDHYGEDALAVLRALVELQRSGIEPRHLRGFRAAAERELGLIESALIPVTRRKDASSRAKALEMAREIAGQLEVVRSSLIRSALGKLSGGAAQRGDRARHAKRHSRRRSGGANSVRHARMSLSGFGTRGSVRPRRSLNLKFNLKVREATWLK